MFMITATDKEQQFIEAYFEAINFTETGDTDQPESGTELDETFVRESVIDCLAFFGRIACYLSDDNVTQAGRDFWLTRNGHGTGFWNRPETYGGNYATMFTTWSEDAGTAQVFFEEEVSK
jgi:hypothetical protein